MSRKIEIDRLKGEIGWNERIPWPAKLSEGEAGCLVQKEKTLLRCNSGAPLASLPLARVRMEHLLGSITISILDQRLCGKRNIRVELPARLLRL